MRAGTLVRRSQAASWARLIGALAVPVLALAALGSRIGIVPAEALVAVLAVGFVLALTALGLGVYALVDIWESGARGAGAAIAGLVYALPALLLLGVVAAAALFYPRLTDVTTDLADPPVLQEPGDPAAERPDPDRFALQGEAYPELGSHTYPLPIADVYSSARALMEDRNWTIRREEPPPSLPPPASPSRPAAAPEIAEADAALSAKATMTQSRGGATASRTDGRPGGDPPPGGERQTESEAAVLQAVARTPLFGFPDDVVLRMRETAGGTQVDMRSASGTGMHDLGQNARRIRRFFADLDVALQPDPNAPQPAVPAEGIPTAAVEPVRPAEAASAGD